MEPIVAGFQTLFAAIRCFRSNVGNFKQMRTAVHFLNLLIIRANLTETPTSTRVATSGSALSSVALALISKSPRSVWALLLEHGGPAPSQSRARHFVVTRNNVVYQAAADFSPLMKASKSALIWSAFVVGMPCGKPW